MGHVLGVRRNIVIGGASKDELLERLRHCEVKLNQYAMMLFACDAFTTLVAEYPLAIIELNVEDLGFPNGATLQEIMTQSAAIDLAPCPLEVGPHLRLQYTDSPNLATTRAERPHQAPPNSLTIVSDPVTKDDDFPRGFYLRQIENVLWLRGYCSPDSHFHAPDDRLIFCENYHDESRRGLPT